MKTLFCVVIFVSYLAFVSAVRSQHQTSLGGSNGFLSNINNQANIETPLTSQDESSLKLQKQIPGPNQQVQNSLRSDVILLSLGTTQNASTEDPPASTTAQESPASTNTQQTSANVSAQVDNTTQAASPANNQPAVQANSTAPSTNNQAILPPPTPIVCNSTDNKFVTRVCSLCDAREAYVLTKDNWFTVGLVHNYKTELSKILSHVESIFSNARWLASFSDDHICIVSSTEMASIDVDNAVFFFTNQHLKDYIKTSLVPLTNSTTVYETGFRYVPLGQDSYIDELTLQYQIDFKLPTSSSSSLDFTKALVTTSTKNVVYSGTINLGTTQLPFEIDASKAAEYYFASASISDLGLTTSDILTRISVQDSSRRVIFEKITPTNGPAYLENYQASFLSFRLVNATNALDQLTIKLGPNLDFAMTPEFRITNGQSSILINMTDPQTMPSLLIEGQALSQNTGKSLVARITKNEQEQTVVFSQNSQDSLQVSDLERMFKDREGSSTGVLLPKPSNFNTIRNFNLLDTQIKVKNNPIPVYQVTAKLLKGTDNVGNLEALVAFVGGLANSQTKTTLPSQNLMIVLPNNTTPLFFEQYLTSQGLEITHYNHDLDTQQYSSVLDGFYSGDRYWNQGSTIAYKFLLSNCSDVAFCQVMTNMMDCQTTPLTLQGNVRNDGAITLATEALPGDISITTISFTDIRLNLNLLVGTTVTSELYLTSKNSFEASDEKSLTFDGKLIFDETHGKLTSKTPQTWKNALGLDFLHISGPELTGVVNPGSCEITDVAANGVMLWGRDCIIISPENLQNVTFLKERCFFGKGELSLNLNDLQKSYVSGIYSGVTPVMALSSILGYNDTFILQKVSKLFTSNKFADFVQIMYVPKKSTTTTTGTNVTSPDATTVSTSEPAATTETTTTTTTTETTATEETPSTETQETALVEVSEGVPAGLSITGRSALLGLEGVTTLHVNVDTKALLGMFNFETLQIANDNILLKRSSAENFHNIVFKISDGYEDAINNQAQMQADLNLVGLDGEATFTMTNDDVSFTGLLHSDMLGSIEVKGDVQGPQINLTSAAFNVKGSVQNNLTQVDTIIQNAAADWSERVKTLITSTEQSLLDLKTLSEGQAQLLCKDDTCPIRSQCQSDPRYVCKSYQKKQVCNNTENYCLNAVLTCSKSESVCINEVTTCVREDQAHPGVCLEPKKECKASDSVCKEWSYTCQGGTIMTCENFDLIDDPAECLEFGWECDEVQIGDPECKSTCELKNQEYNELNQTYTSLSKKYLNAKDNNQKLLDFIDSLKNVTDSSQNFKVLSFEFTVDLNKKLQRKDVSWTVKYTLLGQSRTVDIVDLNLMDQEEFTNKVFTTIGQQLALEKGFQWRKPQDLQTETDELFSLTTPLKSEFLQKIQKLSF